jgi:hypothetical protein
MLSPPLSRKINPLRANNFLGELIPALRYRPHNAARPVHPRALREASLSGTGERWPRTGAKRTPNARRLKSQGPGATDGVTGFFGGSAVTPCQTARRCSSPKRWVETSATEGPAKERLKHCARDAGEKADLRFDIISRRRFPAGIGVCPGVATCRGPWVRWTPGVPRPLGLLPKALRPNDSGAKTRRENAAVRLDTATPHRQPRVHNNRKIP